MYQAQKPFQLRITSVIGRNKRLHMTKADRLTFRFIQIFVQLKDWEMSSGINKFAIIQINYKSTNELKVALDDIYHQLKFENGYCRKEVCNVVYQIHKFDHNEPDCRIEMINGQMCQVYKSKIHRDNVKRIDF